MSGLNQIVEQIFDTFGFELKKKKPTAEPINSVILPKEDGAEDISASQGGIIGSAFNIYQMPTEDYELIKTYRSLAVTSEIEWILTEIKNEIFVFNETQKPIDISFKENSDNFKLSKNIKNKIIAEFNEIYNLLEFDQKGLDLFMRWYIDGRIFLNILPNSISKKGIERIIPIDSLNMKKIVEYPSPNAEGVYNISDIKTYFLYSDIYNVFDKTLVGKCSILNSDSVVYVDSGIYDPIKKYPLSYLWKMIVPYNNLRMMEEALLVYRVVRSPERRVFYVGVGNLSKPRADAYVQELMQRFKNKIIYDSKTGSILDKKNIQSMVEDYWLPRRDDGKGTEVQSLPGAQNLGSVDDVNVFIKKFLNSSNIPTGRFTGENSNFIFGRTAEISREEYRFKKFLDRLRNRFSGIFEELLKTQLILKNIITLADWENLRKLIIWKYAEDNNFIQYKENEVLASRLESVALADPYVNKYYTPDWVMKNILRFDDVEIDKIKEYLEKQKSSNIENDETKNKTDDGTDNETDSRTDDENSKDDTNSNRDQGKEYNFRLLGQPEKTTDNEFGY